MMGALLRRIYSLRHFNTVRKRIRGSKNQIAFRKAILKSVLFDISGNNNRIEIGEGARLNSVVFFIRGDNHNIFIGKNCVFNRGSTIWIEDAGCELSIGEDSTFEDVHLALTEPGSKITIGRDCMFANHIDVRTGDSHSILLEENNRRINHAKNISIEDHVWIAAHAILLKGVRIPAHSVVAAGSVVTRQFEKPGTIIGGNPARQIKEGITWSRERIFDKYSTANFRQSL
ncbi:MAG TPA: acyltransferase [Sideroxyarcus sp.]|nr:acyltransferase [Sideroxyarcus sp.]